MAEDQAASDSSDRITSRPADARLLQERLPGSGKIGPVRAKGTRRGRLLLGRILFEHFYNSLLYDFERLLLLVRINVRLGDATPPEFLRRAFHDVDHQCSLVDQHGGAAVPYGAWVALIPPGTIQ